METQNFCNRLTELLSDVASVRLVDYRTYDLENLPLIIINPSTSTITTTSDESWKHALEVEVMLITKELDFALVGQILQKLKEIKLLTISTIERGRVEINENALYSTTISLNYFLYTESFCY